MHAGVYIAQAVAADMSAGCGFVANPLFMCDRRNRSRKSARTPLQQVGNEARILLTNVVRAGAL